MLKREKGITLVALVITIIVLLILAGVVINLVINDKGIFQKAEESREVYQKAERKEEIELGIMNVQLELSKRVPAQQLSPEILKQELPKQLKNDLTIEKDLSGTYREYDYWIDENYKVHIGEKNATRITATIQISNVGTSSVTVQVEASSKEGTIVGYQYKKNEEIGEVQINNTYTFENLQPETKYRIQAIIIDEKGNQKETRPIEITTKPRTYLYKAGDECEALTGGWERSNYTVGSFKKEADYMEVYGTGGTSTAAWNGCVTANEVDLTTYKNIYFDVEYDNSMYLSNYGTVWFWMRFGINSQKPLNYDNQYYMNGYGGTTNYPINQRVQIKVNVENKEKAYVSVFYAKRYMVTFSIHCKIYNIWLEK